MKITLVTDFKGLETYMNTFEPFLAAGKYAGKGAGFIHEIQVDLNSVFISQKAGYPVGHVVVQRKTYHQL